MPYEGLRELTLEAAKDMSCTIIHRKIYDEVAAHKTPDRRHTPPAFLLAYAIRNITQPTLVHSQIPDLILLLTHLEAVRQRILAQAERALDLNDRAQAAKSSAVRTLSKDECETLLKIIGTPKKRRTSREVFWQAVSQLCEMDIRYLYPYTGQSDLPERMKTHFPFPDLIPGALSTNKSCESASEGEKAQLREIAQRCLKFIEDASEWEDMSKDEFKSIGAAPPEVYTHFPEVKAQFDAAVSGAPEEGKILESIHKYAVMVEEMHDALEAMFAE